jgi:hypothetical protein
MSALATKAALTPAISDRWKRAIRDIFGSLSTAAFVIVSSLQTSMRR